jgi:hypothetical protein
VSSATIPILCEQIDAMMRLLNIINAGSPPDAAMAPLNL